MVVVQIISATGLKNNQMLCYCIWLPAEHGIPT